ncbi:hypothetical protein [Dyadobacter sp. CY356]|uniref:hypothetical protein n=1 Tax=Dyadobacter sp. CY356 TaxID=2906442 RepID=UPI001F484102|nr:hypothetical protein [Dyadobacter sp. CY356]MCF0054856.1 hypothetical protein [Dyadobacter sp. CY356]
MKTKQLLSKTLCTAMFAGALLFGSSSVFAQVKIGNNPTVINAGSALEIESATKALLMPRISLTNTTTWGLDGTSAAGMHVFNTNMSITSSNTTYPTLVSKIGEYYWDGTGWVALAPLVKSTSITSFPQTTPGVVVNIAAGTAGTCGLPFGPIPACAVDLNRNASFEVTNTLSDVLIDMSGAYSVASNTTPVSFYIALAIDKNTPGVYEMVDYYFITNSTTGCSGQYINLKSALKNLPVRSYNVKVFLAPWQNSGAAATVGVGKQALTGSCGNNDFAQQKVIVSISQ